MQDNPLGTILSGNEDDIRRSCDKWAGQAIDQEMGGGCAGPCSEKQTTLGKPVSVTGQGTFFGKAQRKLVFEPTEKKGWWFDRTDLSHQLPIAVSINNLWTTVRNIVIRSGSPHNYMRMVEHIVALKAGMGLDNVVIRMDAGDPPLFDRGSMDLVEAVEEAGIVEQDEKAVYLTVKQPVTVGGGAGSFLTFLPAENNSKELVVDCAVDFKNAIGKQRIVFPVGRSTFTRGAEARTNTTLWMMIYAKTIGKIFADVRNLGYTKKNILIAGPRRYCNSPGLVFNGKSLEAVWHRAALDLLSVIALIDRGRFAGKIISYKSGHALDARMISELYVRDMLEKVG